MVKSPAEKSFNVVFVAMAGSHQVRWYSLGRLRLKF
jgi:hypothetical protein